MTNGALGTLPTDSAKGDMIVLSRTKATRKSFRHVALCKMDHPHGQTDQLWDTSKFNWTYCRRCDTNFDPSGDPPRNLRSLFWGNKRPKASRQIEHRTECVFVFVFDCIVL